VVRVTVQAAAGRMPVVAGTGFNGPLGADMAKRAEKAGPGASWRCLLITTTRRSKAWPPTTRKSAPPPPCRSWSIAAIGPSSRQAWWRAWRTRPTLTFWKDGQGDVRKYQRIMQSVGDRLAWLGGLGDDCVPGYFAVGVQAYRPAFQHRPAHFPGTGGGRPGSRFRAARRLDEKVRPSALRPA